MGGEAGDSSSGSQPDSEDVFDSVSSSGAGSDEEEMVGASSRSASDAEPEEAAGQESGGSSSDSDDNVDEMSPADAMAWARTNKRCTMCRRPVAVTPVTGPAGERLDCDWGCGTELAAGELRYVCEFKCDFDACTICAGDRRQCAALPQSTASGGGSGGQSGGGSGSGSGGGSCSSGGGPTQHCTP